MSFKKGILLSSLVLRVHLCLTGISFAYIDGMYHWDASLDDCLEMK
jgi:hypothetical protein